MCSTFWRRGRASGCSTGRSGDLVIRFIERAHDVSALGVADSAERWCAFCYELHTFVVLAALPGMKIGQADCPKAPTGKHAQLLAVDFRPNHGRRHDLRGLELGASVIRHCDRCRTEHAFVAVDLEPGKELGSADCLGQPWTQPLDVDYPPPPDDDGPRESFSLDPPYR